MSNEQKMREAFEKVHCNNNKHIIRRNEHGDYVLPSIQDAYSGWESATLAAEARIREKCMKVATTVRYVALSGPVERCELDAIISRALTEHKENQG